MDIDVFSPEELPIALSALRAINPELTARHRRFLSVIAELHRADIDLDALSVVSPAETAAVITCRHQRKRLLQLAVIAAMIEGIADPLVIAAIARLAKALGVEERATNTLHEIATHHLLMARFDLTRRILGRFVAAAWRDERWAGVQKMAAPLLDAGEDLQLAKRYRQLGELPAGSFGRAFWHHCTLRGLPFPGERGAVAERFVFHDLGHVLSGYDTDPEGEIQQAAFQSGFVRNDGFSFLFFGIVQFHLGVKLSPRVEPAWGHFDVDRVLTALSRGAACRLDLSDHWDAFAHFARPLEDVRADLGIAPLARSQKPGAPLSREPSAVRVSCLLPDSCRMALDA